MNKQKILKSIVKPTLRGFTYFIIIIKKIMIKKY
jgi:hypothetical protein